MPSRDIGSRRRLSGNDANRESSRSKFSRSQQKPLQDLQNVRDEDQEYRQFSSSSGSQTHPSRNVSMNIPETAHQSTASPTRSRSTIPYPTFSKAHSRESLRPVHATTRQHILTPDPTDIEDQLRNKHSSSHAPLVNTSNVHAPRSPPLNATDAGLKKNGIKINISKSDGNRRVTGKEDRTSLQTPKACDGQDIPVHTSSLRKIEEGQQISISPRKSSSPRSKKHRKYPSASGIEPKSPLSTLEPPKASKELTVRRQTSNSKSVTDSDVTSVAPNNNTGLAHPASVVRDRVLNSSTSQALNGVELHTATSEPLSTSRHKINAPDDGKSESGAPGAGTPNMAPPPPPPPPPPLSPTTLPRVDYLLQNGGLSHLVNRTFVPTSSSNPPQSYQQHGFPQIEPFPRNLDAQNAFASYMKLLDDFSIVMSKNGSIAVATGYRSVARRLLDRLEAVFARNISSEVCQCIMCQPEGHCVDNHEEKTGVSWGEVLELVSGRRELPPWPPFSTTNSPRTLNLADLEKPAPMQKLDIDVPDEYRAHYLRQSKKTKAAVQQWLACQPEDNISPPQEVDDETLTFTMLTYLETEQRTVFAALMKGLISAPKAQTPATVPPNQTLALASKPDFIAKIGLALQRLYRLSNTPRDPECSMYLLKNPSLHNALATLAAISRGEWEILVSGRFDGFLWSGAEEQISTSTTALPQHLATNGRESTPPDTSVFRPCSATVKPGIAPIQIVPAQSLTETSAQRSKSAPSSVRYDVSSTFPSFAPSPGPVQLDEETEIAVLAEVEREIFAGMNALEDAFEALHVRAETVRRALRERGAGLALQAQARKGECAERPKVRGMTPQMGFGFGTGGGEVLTNGISDTQNRCGTADSATTWGVGVSGDSETDDGLGSFDAQSELAPDDSASNVSGRRRRRRHGTSRRSERKTPAPVEEEADE